MTTNTPARETQHTPTPWEAVNGSARCCANGQYIFLPSHESQGRGEAEANAAYIVQCVNGYEALQAQNEALVAALERFEKTLAPIVNELHNGRVNGAWPPTPGDARALAAELSREFEPLRAALKAAQEKRHG